MTPQEQDKGHFDDTEPPHGHEHEHGDGTHHAHDHTHGDTEHRHVHDEAITGDGLAGGPVADPDLPSGDYDDTNQ